MGQARKRRAFYLPWRQATDSQRAKGRCADFRAVQLSYNTSRKPTRMSFRSVPLLFGVAESFRRLEQSLQGTPSASKFLNSFRQRARCSQNSFRSTWIKIYTVLSTATFRCLPRSVYPPSPSFSLTPELAQLLELPWDHSKLSHFPSCELR